MPRTAACLEAVDVLVLAGGLGTRIRPVLGQVPKLLAPISGRPYLWYLLNWLRGYGATRVVLGLGHLAQAVVEYLRQHPPDGLTVEIVIEPEPLGTAGAIRFAADKLRTNPVIVMNGDSFADADLCVLLARHAKSGAVGTILCAEVEDGSRYGRVSTDEDGHIVGFVEKDESYEGTARISAGIYVFSRALLDDIAAGQAVSLERDVFAQLPTGTLAALVGKFKFIDIGTPESLNYANEDGDSIFNTTKRGN